MNSLVWFSYIFLSIAILFYRNVGFDFDFWKGLQRHASRNAASDGATLSTHNDAQKSPKVLSKQAQAIQRARAAFASGEPNTVEIAEIREPLVDASKAVGTATARARAVKSVGMNHVSERSKAAAKAKKRAEISKHLAEAADLDFARAEKIVQLIGSGKVKIQQPMPKQAKQRQLMSALPPMPQKAKEKAAQSLLDIDTSLDDSNTGMNAGNSSGQETFGE